MNDLEGWGRRWRVSSTAMFELSKITQSNPVPMPSDDISEAAVSQRVSLKASKHGIRLFRNNVGACKDDTGRHIRYGLANTSKQMNTKVKSADLIGITPVIIRPEHVGQTFGLFTSIESKRGNWHYTGRDREEAQRTWAEIVRSLGGISFFANDDTVIDEICIIKK